MFFIKLMLVLGPVYWIPGVPLKFWSTLKDLLLILCIAWQFVDSAVHRRNPLSYVMSTYEGLLLLTLVLASFAGVLSSSDPVSALRLWVRITIPVLLVSAAYNSLLCCGNDCCTTKRLMTWMMAPVLASSAYVVLSRLGVIPSFEPPGEFAVPLTRMGQIGLSYRTNAMSWSVAFVWPIVFYSLLYSHNFKTRLLWGLSASVLLVAAMLTGGRGGLLAIAITSVMGILSKGVPRNLSAVLVTTIIVGAALLGANQAYGDSRSMVQALVREQGDEFDLNQFSSSRVEVYSYGLALVADNPLAGVGFGRFAVALRESGGPSLGAHNTYLSFAGEAGVLSGLIALLFTTWAVVNGIRHIHHGDNTDRLDYLIWLGVVTASVLNTYSEDGAMFSNLSSSFPFWFGLAALAIHRHVAHQRGVKARKSGRDLFGGGPFDQAEGDVRPAHSPALQSSAVSGAVTFKVD